MTFDLVNVISTLVKVTDLLQKMRSTSDTELALEESERMKALTDSMQRMVLNKELGFTGSLTTDHLSSKKAGATS